jgi:ribonucleoside-diphosphate reductase alpha chain
VGLLNDKLYETFAFHIPDGAEDYLVNGKGVIRKDKKAYYFVYENGYTISDLNKLTNLPDEQILTRLISGMMRHGVNPTFIIEQIDKCPLEIVSFGKALARVIKKYIPEKELLERYKCTDCGSKNIRFEEGCGKCLDCGSSKCG